MRFKEWSRQKERRNVLGRDNSKYDKPSEKKIVECTWRTEKGNIQYSYGTEYEGDEAKDKAYKEQATSIRGTEKTEFGLYP